MVATTLAHTNSDNILNLECRLRYYYQALGISRVSSDILWLDDIQQQINNYPSDSEPVSGGREGPQCRRT